jgi:hypothetical protein
MFKRKKEMKEPELLIKPSTLNRVEVEVAKDASKQAAAAAKKVNQHFTDLLVENGITVKIYLAAGGKHKGK